MLINTWLADRDYRDAITMIYRSDARTLEWLQEQSNYRRALLREVAARKEQA